MNVNFFIDQLSSGILHCHVPSQGRIATLSLGLQGFAAESLKILGDAVV